MTFSDKRCLKHEVLCARLNELITINSKSKIGAKKALEFEKGTIPFFTSGNTILYTDQYLVDNENLFINDGGNAGIKYYNGQACYADHVISIKTNKKILCKYLYYYLKNKENYIDKELFRGTGLKNICRKKFLEMKIYYPSIECQKKIILILDDYSKKLDNYINLLEEELKMLNKQYITYLKKNFNKESEKKIKLSEIIEFSRGKRVVKKELETDCSSDLYPVFQNSLTPLGYYNNYNFIEGQTFIISAGAAGKIGFSTSKIWAADDCLKCKCSDRILSRYLYYYLKCNEHYINSMVRKASVPRISKEVFERMEIALPSLDEQKKYIELFKQYELLNEKLNKIIFYEIEARKKQYEYYRDKLLSFKEVEVNE